MATPEQWLQCPKCKEYSGNDWSQCDGKCPLQISPHYDPTSKLPSEPLKVPPPR